MYINLFFNNFEKKTIMIFKDFFVVVVQFDQLNIYIMYWTTF